MMKDNSKYHLAVGTDAAITKVGPESHGCGIFEKAYPDGRRTWAVARLPRTKTWQDIPPGSALAEFDSLTVAEDALKRWSTAPPAPRMARKPRSAIAGACRRNSNRPRRGKVGLGQQELPLRVR
jgi:hypothetical protein